MQKTKPLTFKQESFAQKYIEMGGNQSEAYRRAYNASNMKNETIQSKAYLLKKDPRVTARIHELMQEHKERHMITVDTLTKELDEAKELAFQLEQVSAGVSAIMGKAKIHGFDKSTVTMELPTVIRRNLTGKTAEDAE